MKFTEEHLWLRVDDDEGEVTVGLTTYGAAELGEAIEAQHSRPVRTEMTLAAASGRLFPAIKRGLGYASACTIPRAG